MLQRSLLAAPLLAALLSACATVSETGRSQLLLIDSRQEIQLGLSQFDKLKQETPVSGDAQQNAMLQRVGRRIAAVAPLPDARWEFVLFDQPDTPNAFCLPGGKVGVYSGLMPIAENEAGLATVIGHEVAHAVAHHGAERLSHGMLVEAGGKLLDTSLQAQSPEVRELAMAAYGIGGKLGVILPYSRTQELEADHLGLLYMARAGYDPREAIAFWKRFQRAKEGKESGMNFEFLSTHPLDATRIAELQRLLPQAMQEYGRAGGTGR
jgi:predicted Zn-dependent protease